MAFQMVGTETVVHPCTILWHIADYVCALNLFISDTHWRIDPLSGVCATPKQIDWSSVKLSAGNSFSTPDVEVSMDSASLSSFC
jgi:hypothetical protein